MRLSTKGEYASRAMLELARNYEKRLLHIRDISKLQTIPQRFLEQILLQLRYMVVPTRWRLTIILQQQ